VSSSETARHRVVHLSVLVAFFNLSLIIRYKFQSYAKFYENLAETCSSRALPIQVEGSNRSLKMELGIHTTRSLCRSSIIIESQA
jgi:hypothetical protein